jgi:5-formyltetrahydrofolate cyclo-ligase
MTKEEIRRLYREKRTQLSNEELQKRQNDLEYQYTLFDLSPYQTVHVFLSIQKHNEPNTQPLIDLLFSQ